MSEAVVTIGTVGAVGSLIGFLQITASTHHTGEYNADQVNISHLQQQNSAIRLLEREGVIHLGNKPVARNDKAIETIKHHEPHQAGEFIYGAGEVGSIAIGVAVFGVAGYLALKQFGSRFLYETNQLKVHRKSTLSPLLGAGTIRICL